MSNAFGFNPADGNTDPADTFVAMPVPPRFVPQVTSLLATLYAAESGTTPAADRTAVGDQQSSAHAGSTHSEDDPEGRRTRTGPHPVWTSELYADLINKGVVSSNRMVAVMDHLPTGRDFAIEIPDLATSITASGTTITAEEINVALRWFGKFTRKAFPDSDGHVWPFEVSRQEYPKGYTGTRRLLFWFEPEQAEAWRQARS
ncbi:hypothetical protein ACH9EU_01685 [Kocuria sp. M1R5S2]|uniref:hypothetical protein n=1 Tax=Kocuria rhizosphaerae TaxID=3376285 RepID=UPI0037A004B2